MQPFANRTPASDPATLPRQQRQWGGISAEVIAIDGGRTQVPAMSDYRLGLHLGAAVNADCRCDGQRLRHVQADGDMVFVPPGLPGSWQDDSACRILRIRLSPAVMRAAADDLGFAGAIGDLQPRLHFRDPALEQVARALLALLAEPVAQDTSRDGTSTRVIAAETGDSRYAGLLGGALALRLLQASSSRLPGSVPVGLSIRQRRRLDDFIEAHLDQPLPLAELAALLQISVSHLTALFRRSHGISLHQYILQRRLAQARHLLQDSDMPISEVALATGFAHQSHLANLLRRHYAVTPRQLRRGDRS
jgi:AraC family transcriptional regulator